jgi:hypothetical protein
MPLATVGHPRRLKILGIPLDGDIAEILATMNSSYGVLSFTASATCTFATASSHFLASTSFKAVIDRIADRGTRRSWRVLLLFALGCLVGLGDLYRTERTWAQVRSQ